MSSRGWSGVPANRARLTALLRINALQESNSDVAGPMGSVARSSCTARVDIGTRSLLYVAAEPRPSSFPVSTASSFPVLTVVSLVSPIILNYFSTLLTRDPSLESLSSAGASLAELCVCSHTLFEQPSVWLAVTEGETTFLVKLEQRCVACPTACSRRLRSAHRLVSLCAAAVVCNADAKPGNRKLENLKLVELRALCKAQQLSENGAKKTLINRLQSAALVKATDVSSKSAVKSIGHRQLTLAEETVEEKQKESGQTRT